MSLAEHLAPRIFNQLLFCRCHSSICIADHSCCGGGRSFSGFLYFSRVPRFKGVPEITTKVPNVQAMAQQSSLTKGLIHTEPDTGKAYARVTHWVPAHCSAKEPISFHAHPLACLQTAPVPAGCCSPLDALLYQFSLSRFAGVPGVCVYVEKQHGSVWEGDGHWPFFDFLFLYLFATLSDGGCELTHYHIHTLQTWLLQLLHLLFHYGFKSEVRREETRSAWQGKGGRKQRGRRKQSRERAGRRKKEGRKREKRENTRQNEKWDFGSFH